MSVKVKICGITRSEDAEFAVSQGATAIGFIFVHNSPRYIDPDEAKRIIHVLPPFVTPVGVVPKMSRPEALALVAKTGIRCLQMHDNNHAQEFAEFPIPHYDVYRVSPEFNIKVLQGVKASAFMLDTYIEGTLGGTGRTFDWDVAVKAKQYGRLILSGGINPGNIADAIHRVGPYAVDVNSGVERTPGVKDHKKLQSLFEAVAQATQ